MTAVHAGEFFWIDAFADRPFSGNPAVVCLLWDAIAESSLQGLAREFNVSETCFLHGGEGEYAIRWFTPTRELPLVGHAMLAAAHAVLTCLEPHRDRLNFASALSGDLPAFRVGAEIAIRLPSDATQACPTPDALRVGLGLVPQETRIGRHYVAVLRSPAEVEAIRPDFEALASLDRPTIAVTAPGDDCDYVLRFFAPANEVPEDPVSGVAQCSLMPYWAARLRRDTLRSVQLSQRGGVMRCRVAGDAVEVAGPCRTIARGKLEDIR